MKDGLDALCGGGGLHECTFNMGSRIFAVTFVPRLSRMGSTRLASRCAGRMYSHPSVACSSTMLHASDLVTSTVSTAGSATVARVLFEMCPSQPGSSSRFGLCCLVRHRQALSRTNPVPLELCTLWLATRGQQHFGLSEVVIAPSLLNPCSELC